MTDKEHHNNIVDRLKKRSDFLRVQGAERKWIAKSLIVQCTPRGEDVAGGAMRVGLTVTKKVFPRAVDRNRVKRRLRALSADIMPAQGKAGFDYVLIGRREGLTREFAALRADLIWCLGKLHAADAD